MWPVPEKTTSRCRRFYLQELLRYDVIELSKLGVAGLREVITQLGLDLEPYSTIYPTLVNCHENSLAVFVQDQLIRAARRKDPLMEEMNLATVRSCSELTHGE